MVAVLLLALPSAAVLAELLSQPRRGLLVGGVGDQAVLGPAPVVAGHDLPIADDRDVGEGGGDVDDRPITFGSTE